MCEPRRPPRAGYRRARSRHREGSTFPVSRLPFPVSDPRRTALAPGLPPACRRIARSGARCRGALSRPRRDRPADRPAARSRSCASAAQAGVTTPVIEERPAVRDGAARDQAEEYRVIPARGLRLLLALDAGEHAFEHGNAVLGLTVADAVETVRVVRRE